MIDMIDITDKCIVLNYELIDKSTKGAGGVVNTQPSNSYVTVQLNKEHHHLLNEIVIIDCIKYYLDSISSHIKCRFKAVK